MPKVIPGGYELADMQACTLPEPVDAGFKEVVQHLKGVDYTPVLYIGQQVVAGMNYMIICRQKPVVLDPLEHLVEFVINRAHTTGDWSLVSIERIV